MKILSMSLLAMVGLLVPHAVSGDCDAAAGSKATLSTLAHGVKGTVTILNDNTLLVENFFYDGGGISVYFYLGVDANSFATGVRIGPQLLGMPFNNGSLVLPVPGNVSLENYHAISVWCEAVQASFGHGTFVAPPAPSLTLSAVPGTANPGDTLTLTACGGNPGSALGLVAVKVNGTALFTPVFFATFVADGGWKLPAVIPAGLAGIELDFQVWGYTTPFKIAGSNSATILFL